VTGQLTILDRAGWALDHVGGFIEENIGIPCPGTGLFLLGAVTAPVSTAILTTQSYSPGLGSTISPLEDAAVGFVVDKASAFAQERGLDLAKAGRMVLGGQGVIGAAVLGYKALPLFRKGAQLVRGRFGAAVGAAERGLANWGTGRLRRPARALLANEGVLVDATHGLQSRTAGLSTKWCSENMETLPQNTSTRSTSAALTSHSRTRRSQHREAISSIPTSVPKPLLVEKHGSGPIIPLQ